MNEVVVYLPEVRTDYEIDVSGKRGALLALAILGNKEFCRYHLIRYLPGSVMVIREEATRHMCSSQCLIHNYPSESEDL